MINPHACFQIGVMTGLGIAFVLAALFGWGFIAYVEGWTLGRAWETFGRGTNAIIERLGLAPWWDRTFGRNRR